MTTYSALDNGKRRARKLLPAALLSLVLAVVLIIPACGGDETSLPVEPETLAAEEAATTQTTTAEATKEATTTTAKKMEKRKGNKSACGPGGKRIFYQGQPRCLSEGERKLVYYELVAEQDKGGDIRAFRTIAARFELPYRIVRFDIPFEGASKNWPLPPAP